MDTSAPIDLAVLFEKEPMDHAALAALREAAFDDSDSLNRYLELIAGLESRAQASGGRNPSEAYKLGVSYLALGDAERAINWLSKAESIADAHYYIACARRDQGLYDEAIAEFEKAARQGASKLDCDLHRAECLILKDDAAGARKILQEHSGSAASSAAYHYVQGRLAEEEARLAEAMDEYDAAIVLDSGYASAMFRLAYLLDLHGSDDRALELYTQCSELPFVATNALINLAVIFEDEGEYDKASSCLRRILAVNPNHPRAMLYYKDVLASTEMFIDEAQLRAKEEHDAVLDIPVTDFELSVRSRNCLKKMNINTLGDLLRITEQELLAYKNFGETSLREIKAMLAQKGLSLGMHSNKAGSSRFRPLPALAIPEAPVAVPEGAGAELYTRPVSSIDFSVRSRKCLQRLGITTIGELVSRSEQELLESRNFGTTSLREIKDKLTEMGLGLRGA
ncbi:MAG TPA: DNA-directed RNA polymerase subunit alpha C-terminal domain-containing protein [Phycisphaerae bacterium]|nr:DNA-directed RNA polymerase subunit alpha C-terminal domain-containing protein [Phycisphaerae bacterium]